MTKFFCAIFLHPSSSSVWWFVCCSSSGVAKVFVEHLWLQLWTWCVVENASKEPSWGFSPICWCSFLSYWRGEEIVPSVNGLLIFPFHSQPTFPSGNMKSWQPLLIHTLMLLLSPLRTILLIRDRLSKDIWIIIFDGVNDCTQGPRWKCHRSSNTLNYVFY